MKLREFLDLYAGDRTTLSLLSGDWELFDTYTIDSNISSTDKIDSNWFTGNVLYFYMTAKDELNVCVDI